ALYDNYRQLQGWQHQMMADHYTDIMQKAIKEVLPLLNDNVFLYGYDDNSLWDWDKFYEYLSYRGLKDTQAGGEYFSDPNNNISLYLEDTKTNSTKTPNRD